MVGVQAQHDSETEGQHHDQQDAGGTNPDGPACQGALGCAFDPSIKTTVPKIIGDAACTADGQAPPQGSDRSALVRVGLMV